MLLSIKNTMQLTLLNAIGSDWFHATIQKSFFLNYNPETIRVYILQKGEIKLGYKLAGRHGNKGIVSKNLPEQDTPYLQDGRPVALVFNQLGVPSRKNVGQIFECSQGLTGSLLAKHYWIAPFDERYEQEAVKTSVFWIIWIL